jgi:hypothetical protein
MTAQNHHFKTEIIKTNGLNKKQAQTKLVGTSAN